MSDILADLDVHVIMPAGLIETLFDKALVTELAHYLLLFKNG